MPLFVLILAAPTWSQLYSANKKSHTNNNHIQSLRTARAPRLSYLVVSLTTLQVRSLSVLPPPLSPRLLSLLLFRDFVSSSLIVFLFLFLLLLVYPSLTFWIYPFFFVPHNHLASAKRFSSRPCLLL